MYPALPGDLHAPRRLNLGVDGPGALVRATSVLGGLHHEYSI